MNVKPSVNFNKGDLAQRIICVLSFHGLLLLLVELLHELSTLLPPLLLQLLQLLLPLLPLLFRLVPVPLLRDYLYLRQLVLPRLLALLLLYDVLLLPRLLNYGEIASNDGSLLVEGNDIVLVAV
jgi:hypothetical protein